MNKSIVYGQLGHLLELGCGGQPSSPKNSQHTKSSSPSPEAEWALCPSRLLREGQRGTRGIQKFLLAGDKRNMMCAGAHPGEYYRCPILLFEHLLPRYAAVQRTCLSSQAHIFGLFHAGYSSKAAL